MNYPLKCILNEALWEIVCLDTISLVSIFILQMHNQTNYKMFAQVCPWKIMHLHYKNSHYEGMVCSSSTCCCFRWLKENQPLVTLSLCIVNFSVLTFANQTLFLIGSMSGWAQNACENLMYSKMVTTFKRQNTFCILGKEVWKRQEKLNYSVAHFLGGWQHFLALFEQLYFEGWILPLSN